MPLYEYLCLHCDTKFSVLVRGVAEAYTAECTVCGGKELARVVTAFAYHKSKGTIREESGRPESPGSGYYRDPRNIGRWAEAKFNELGLELPAGVEGKIQAAREGELPEPL